MNGYLNKIPKTDDVDYVIAGDTDSIYLNLGPLVDTVYKDREKDHKSVVSSLTCVRGTYLPHRSKPCVV